MDQAYCDNLAIIITILLWIMRYSVFISTLLVLRIYNKLDFTDRFTIIFRLLRFIPLDKFYELTNYVYYVFTCIIKHVQLDTHVVYR